MHADQRGLPRIGILLLLLVTLNGRRLNAADDPVAARPNVLLIAIDDLNDWVGCLGGHPDARTPHIDGLAARGMLFTNAHCQAPLCGPSRASLLSGRYPHSTGVYQQPRKKPGLAGDRNTFAGQLLPEYFARHGYTTFGGGKITHGYPMHKAFQHSGGQFGGSGPKPGDKTVRFQYTPDLSIPFTGTQTDWGAFPDSDEKMPDYKAASWAIEQIGKSHRQPFFLAVGFVRPHVPFYVPQKWFDLFPLDKLTLPAIADDDLDDVPEIGRQLHELPRYPQRDWLRADDNKQLRLCVQAYLACTAFVDHQVGRVLRAVEQSPHAGNTVIVLFSDHGYHLGEKHRVSKHSLWEESTRVPLIVMRPGEAQARTCEHPVGLIDIYPTLLDVCGLPPRMENEGASLVPLLDQPAAAWRDATITTYGRANHALRTTRHRYISYEDGSEELYDHENDPHEWKNLARDPEHYETLISLRSRLPDRDADYHPVNRPQAVNAWFAEHYQRNRLAADQPEPPVFDGRTLDNWMTTDGNPVPDGWEVIEGAIHLRKTKKRSGHIVTRRTFGDFRLSFEWRIAQGGNSGLKYRVRKYGGRTLGLEYQILDRKGVGKGSTGSIYALYAPDESKELTLKPEPEFNTSQIIVIGNQIEHWLNGQRIARATVGDREWDERVAQSKFSGAADFSRNRFGRLMLTDHGAEVWYRNMKMETTNVHFDQNSE